MTYKGLCHIYFLLYEYNIVMADRALELKSLEKKMLKSISNVGNVFNNGLTPSMIDMDAIKANSGGGKSKRTRRKKRPFK